MSYGSRNNGQIKTYWPDDTDTCFYLTDGYTLLDIIDKVKEKWGDIDMSNIDITAERIHTDCLTYDLYDAGDWTNFTVVTKTR